MIHDHNWSNPWADGCIGCGLSYTEAKQRGLSCEQAQRIKSDPQFIGWPPLSDVARYRALAPDSVT